MNKWHVPMFDCLEFGACWGVANLSSEGSFVSSSLEIYQPHSGSKETKDCKYPQQPACTSPSIHGCAAFSLLAVYLDSTKNDTLHR
eukprot:6085854-Amphidinium_carterae.1